MRKALRLMRTSGVPLNCYDYIIMGQSGIGKMEGINCNVKLKCSEKFLGSIPRAKIDNIIFDDSKFSIWWELNPHLFKIG